MRLVAAAEVLIAGPRRAGGGVANDRFGAQRHRLGLKDLDRPPLEPGRVRRPGSGRPHLCARDQTLLEGNAFHPEWNDTIKPQ